MYSGVELATPRCTMRKPSLDRDEICVKVNLDLPDSLFEQQQLQATITVGEDQVGGAVVDAEVINNLVDVARAEGILLEIMQPEEGDHND